MVAKKPSSLESTHLYQSLQNVRTQYRRHPSEAVPAAPMAGETRAAAAVDVNEEIARAQKIKNDNAEQDIVLKRQTLNRLFRFLSAETVLIFLFAFAQAIHWPAHFHLEEWSFKLVVAATIGQITTMLYVAVRYLFPKSRND